MGKRKQMIVLLIGLVLVCVLCVQMEAGPITKELVLASSQNARYVIVCPKGASPAERLAAEQLERYLERMAGVDFRVADKLAKHSIVVCGKGSLPKISPDVEIPELRDEGYGLFKRKGNLYLIGAQGRSVLYAVYELLHRLGCRWLAPAYNFYEGANEFVPKHLKLVYVQESDVVEQPVLKYRKLSVEEGHSHNTQNLLQMIEWMPKLRFNILVIPIDYEGKGRVRWDNWRERLTPELKKRGIMIEVGGHGYPNFISASMEDGQLFEKHPEWFGMDEKGSRSREHRRVFCTSNPGAVAYLQRNVLAYLNKHPEIDIFEFWPPDSERWCVCDACKSMGNESDRHARLVSQMVKLLKKEKLNVQLECIAYSKHVEPPEKEPLDESVLVDFSPIDQTFEWQIYENQAAKNKFYSENMMKWLKAFGGDFGVHTYFRKYMWRSLPNIIPHFMQKDLKFYRDIGVKGITVYAEPGDWFTYELNHYVLGHLEWDPDTNVDSLIEDFCAIRYGPAAKMARSVYATLEEVVRHGCNIPFTAKKSPAQYKDFARKIQSCVKQVKKANKKYGTDIILRENLGRLNLMLEYAAKDLAIQHHTAIKGSKTEKLKKVDQLSAFIQSNGDKGIFLDHYRLRKPRLHRFYRVSAN